MDNTDSKSVEGGATAGDRFHSLQMQWLKKVMAEGNCDLRNLATKLAFARTSLEELKAQRE